MNIVSVYKRFPRQVDCLEYLEEVRWKSQPKCPYCQSTNVTPMPKESRHHCNNCNTSFSVTVGTIFHKTKIDLQKWFLAITIILNAKKGVSARQLARDLEVNKNTAWYMAMRIRKAMTDDRELLEGIVEVDETYVGGKKRRGEDGGPAKRGRGTSKTPVVGAIERDGKVRAKVVKNVSAKTLMSMIRENIDVSTATVITDEFTGYLPISKFVKHQTINHSKWYSDGDIHTNNIEGFWALLKRGLVGQYHKVSIRHLQKYVDEFCYRHNNRKNDMVFEETITRALGGMA